MDRILMRRAIRQAMRQRGLLDFCDDEQETGAGSLSGTASSARHHAQARGIKNEAVAAPCWPRPNSLGGEGWDAYTRDYQGTRYRAARFSLGCLRRAGAQSLSGMGV
jgi:hypothetical protein